MYFKKKRQSQGADYPQNTAAEIVGVCPAIPCVRASGGKDTANGGIPRSAEHGRGLCKYTIKGADSQEIVSSFQKSGRLCRPLLLKTKN